MIAERWFINRLPDGELAPNPVGCSDCRRTFSGLVAWAKHACEPASPVTREDPQ